MIGILARVSTEEQARTGYSIDNQIREGIKKAGTSDVKKYIDDGYSGEFLERPGLTQLRKDVKEGIITTVICLDPDRLARKLMLQLIITDELEKNGAELVFVSTEFAKTPEGQLFYSMRGAISEFEKAKINERMSSGRREKARKGKVVKNTFTYGYDYDKENSEYVINEDEARVVQLIFELFTKPNQIAKGMNGIARYLTDNLIPTKRGAEVWHRNVVRQILMKEAYTGRMPQNRWNTEGMLGNKYRAAEHKVSMTVRPKEEWIYVDVPQIISPEKFEHAQRLIGESRRRHTKESMHQYLLSGLLRCTNCGNTMTGRNSKNWGKYVYEYTDKKNSVGAKEKGCGRRIACAKIDELVWDTILNWLNNPEEIAATMEETQVSYMDNEIERVEQDIEKTKAARKRVIKLFSSDLGIGEEEIRDELRELSDREDALSKRLTELRSKQEDEQRFESSRNLMSETLEYYLDLNPDELTFEDKQNIIRMVAKEILVGEDEVQIIPF